MKRISIACAVIGFFLAAALVQGAVLLDKVIAIVDKEVVTWSDLYKLIEFEAPPAVKGLPEKDRQAYFKKNESQFLESLIEMRLQIQEARRLGIGVSEDDVNKAVDGVRQKMNVSKEAFEATIKKEGISMADYRLRIKEQILVGRTVDSEVRNKIVISEADIKDYLQAHPEYTKDNEGYHIAQIFIVPKGEQKDVEVRLKIIYDALNTGTPFSDVAKKFSDDQASSTGGDLGFVKKDHLSKEFLDVISKLREGEISPPFGSDMGIHIIQLREARLFKSEAEFRELVRQKVVEERFARAYKHWRRGLRDRAYVEIMLN